MKQEDRKTLADLHLAAFHESIIGLAVTTSWPNWHSLGIWIADRVSRAFAGRDLREESVRKDEIERHLHALLSEIVTHEVVMAIRIKDGEIFEKVMADCALLVLQLEARVTPGKVVGDTLRIIIGHGDRYDQMWDPPPSGYLLQAARGLSEAKLP